ARLVRQQVVEVRESKPVRLRIRLVANLARPAEPELHGVRSHEPGYFLVQVVRVVSQREDFGISGTEEAGHIDTSNPLANVVEVRLGPSRRRFREPEP